MKRSLKGILIITIAGMALAASVIGVSGCSRSRGWSKTELKDMSAAGYSWSFFQRSEGTEHNRHISLFVDWIESWPGTTSNVLEGSYYNTGTEATEHLRDPQGRMILSQSEPRRFYEFWDNARNDRTSIMLLDPNRGQLYSADMTRFKTQWWGDSDTRTISVNKGPIMFRLEGVTEHLGIKTQDVFAVVFPKGNNDYSWLFDQDQALEARKHFEALEQLLETTDFKPDDYNVLMSTRDSDSWIDWMGIERIPAQGELFNGSVSYVIAPNYFGPNNQPFRSKGGLYGHRGAPDKHNKLGSSLDTVLLALGNIKNPEDWKPKAKIIVDHPSWSNQTEYHFVKIHGDGTEEVMGTLQRSYNDLTPTGVSSEGKTVKLEARGTNNYLAKGDLQFMEDYLTLVGGQLVPLGLDYKTSYLEYALDNIRIAEAVTPGIDGVTGVDSELVASLNVNADVTIANVVRAAKNIFGVDAPYEFKQLLYWQSIADEAWQQRVKENPWLLQSYGIITAPAPAIAAQK